MGVPEKIDGVFWHTPPSPPIAVLLQNRQPAPTTESMVSLHADYQSRATLLFVGAWLASDDGLLIGTNIEA
ncbi:hypothetical protein [Pseudomonas sp. H3(2019)]|uniref:hypothetical protein n=1 Tax=Pseudomonas sp. H3(2019) TaxID=2598724 RepID=UPI001194E04D|nr:hypothetical protein [Pseudomonas sp. H3(2019)]TVT85096.1 hypothetical protein FPT12_05555 [Pseudomonas sp. H3(2019)]